VHAITSTLKSDYIKLNAGARASGEHNHERDRERLDVFVFYAN
jgi:hypothetical protein